MVRALKNADDSTLLFLLENNNTLSTKNARVVFQIIIYIFELYILFLKLALTGIVSFNFIQTIKG